MSLGGAARAMATIEHPEWIVDGRRVALERGSLFTRILVDGERLPLLVPPTEGCFPFEVGARKLAIEVGLQGRARAWAFVLHVDGVPVAAHGPVAARTPAPEGARCPEHPDEPARFVCARCGRFTCARCAGFDEATCRQCHGIVHGANWVPGPRRSPAADTLTASAFALAFTGAYVTLMFRAPPISLLGFALTLVLAGFGLAGDRLARRALRTAQEDERAAQWATALDLGLPALAVVVGLGAAAFAIAAAATGPW